MTRPVRLILVAVFTLSLPQARAQEPFPMPSAAPRATPQHDARITGTVTCADTHRPARGAVVWAEALPSADGTPPPANAVGSAMTASDGTYSIGSLPSGRYAIIVVLPGYLTEMQQVLRDANVRYRPGGHPDAIHTAAEPLHTLWLGDGQTLQSDVLLQRGAALSGHIQYPDNTPASQVMLMLEDGTHEPATDNETRMRQNIMANVESQFTKQSLRPDDRGQFRLFGLQPGKYRLAVLQPSNHGARDGEDGVEITGDHNGVSPDPFATRFYAGDTTHSAKATVFDLHSGEEISDIVITLPLNAFHAIRGLIRASDGRIPNGAIVSLVDTTDPTTTFSASAKEDGRFRFPQVPAGSYRLTCDRATISHTVHLRTGEGDIYTNAFAAQTLLVNVSSDDLNNVEFSLQEIPLTDELKYINTLSQPQ